MKPIIVALVGNPNGGKTTLFNALTGGHQIVGNWAGVTVELKQGQFTHAGVRVTLIDLPGCYTLEAFQKSAIDEKITVDYIFSQSPSIIVNVVDALQLDRHLSLTLQLLEQGFPTIVVVNKINLAAKKGLIIDLPALARRLNCVVFGLTGSPDSLVALKEAILKQAQTLIPLEQASKCQDPLSAEQTAFSAVGARYAAIREHLAAVLTSTPSDKLSLTASLDNLILHRWLSFPLFFLLMYGVFWLTAEVGGGLQSWFSKGLHFLCVEKLAESLEGLQVPHWLIELLAEGLGLGVQTTLSFIPVLTCLFFCLAFLKNSGYMARGAFVMDRVMQCIGLSGKSFVPLILGFSCNVPAILAARTLENRRERILTILMIPFMSCGARLAIYALFVAAFFKDQGQNIIFGLYLTGIVVALLTGLALRKALLKKEEDLPFIMELPAYQLPHLGLLLKITYQRVQQFLVKAGVIIIPLCMFIGLLGSLKTAEGDTWLTVIGQQITPVFSPIGIEPENWPATMGLLTGVLAKEVVVGTLSALYMERSQGQPVLGVIAEQFGSTEAAVAYLLFILLYFPCVSVLATIVKELGGRWALFSAAWTTGIAYAVAVLFYQTTQFFHHPLYSGLWISGILLSGGVVLYGLKRWAFRSLSGRLKPFPTHIVITHP